jgi:DNA-binding transcriptional regulator YhcF (GntR family)
MKKVNRVLREILHRVYERNEFFMSQKALAQACGVSMDTVNRLVAKLNQFRSIEKKPLGFRVTEPEKILTYWAATRNLARDITYSTYSANSVSEIEDGMPRGSVFTMFSGYSIRFNETPTYYEEVYVYADQDAVKRKFPESRAERRNLFVLRQDPHLERTSKNDAAPIAQLYVDFWQLGGSPADRFLLELKKKLKAKPVEALKALVRKENIHSSHPIEL